MFQGDGSSRGMSVPGGECSGGWVSRGMGVPVTHVTGLGILVKSYPRKVVPAASRTRFF